MDFVKATSQYTKKSAITIKRNWKILILLLLFAFGMLIGTNIIKQSDNCILELFSKLFKYYIEIKKGESILNNFISSFCTNLFFVLLTFILGLCVVGIPFLVCIPIIKGIGIGMLCGYMYLNYTFGGLGYCVLIIYPGLIIALFALFMSCNFAMSYSYRLLLISNGNIEKVAKGESDLKIYCVRGAITLAITLISSIIDSIVIKLFSNLFPF